ncbi:c-type cytochrome biogenesis protein CcsB [Propionicicella superfundia]|uniref:c-type cytochrome biogenesis protein CcsB n=1 Tax=Propionicicella superfundia TaxID=348582 RepID=UPI00041C8993|nr:c-type cytochrome biogenesis protein CcsB [Propionicicella superfundia]
MSEYSQLAMVASAVVYLLAFMAYAAEWAAARALPSQRVVADRRRSRVRAAVPAGAAPAADVDGPDTGTPASEDLTAARIRVDMFGRIGIGLTMVAFVSHLAGVVLRGLAAQRLPWGNMYEFVTSAMLAVVGAYLVLVLWRGIRWLGLVVTLLAAIAQGFAVTVLFVEVAPLVPALHSVWFVIHIVAAVIAAGAFNLGGLASILYLVRDRAERKGELRGYLAKLPSAAAIDTFAYRMHAFAVPVWTFTIAAGSIWAQYAWGRFWGWDPKETWSLITWVVYAGYLHARLTAGWKGARAAWIAIVGLATFWFNFVGINLLVSGLHSYAGV